MNAYPIVGPTPCEPCLSISQQNIIAICTPKTIHLWKFDLFPNRNAHIIRTYVSLEELNCIQDAIRPKQHDWISYLHGGRQFRTCCWAWNPENPTIDQLVVLTTDGNLVLLKNSPQMGFPKGWKFATVDMPEGIFTSIARFESFIFASDITGNIYRWSSGKKNTLTISSKGIVSRIFPTSTSVLFAVTVNGLVYRCDFSQSNGTLICDDGILQPGPSIIIEYQNQKLVVLSKFNRLYFIDDSMPTKVKTIMVASDCPITGLESVKEGRMILIGMMDNSWHLFNWISMTFEDISKTLVKPEEHSLVFEATSGKSSQELGEEEGDDDDDDEQVANEGAVQDSAKGYFYLLDSQVNFANPTSKFRILTHYNPSEEHLSTHLWTKFSEIIQSNDQKALCGHQTACKICGLALEKGRLWTCKQGHFFEL